MEWAERRLDGIRVVEVSGRLDAAEASSIGAALASGGVDHRVVCSMAGVSFIDSTALAMLVQGMKRARELQGDLVLAELPPRVRIVFDLTGLDHAFDIYPTAEDAAAALAARP